MLIGIVSDTHNNLKNVKKVITGDGADEIFAGYNFLIKKDHDELQTELKRMKKINKYTKIYRWK